MNAIDYRRAHKEIRRLCADQGISCANFPDKGKGSHTSWIFERTATGEKVRVVLVAEREISPGVQRGILHYLADHAVANNLAAAVYRIVATVFR